MAGSKPVQEGMNQVDYGFFDRVTESTFHSGGHWGVGGLYGTMTDKWTSRKWTFTFFQVIHLVLVLIKPHSC